MLNWEKSPPCPLFAKIRVMSGDRVINFLWNSHHYANTNFYITNYLLVLVYITISVTYLTIYYVIETYLPTLYYVYVGTTSKYIITINQLAKIQSIS